MPISPFSVAPLRVYADALCAHAYTLKFRLSRLELPTAGFRTSLYQRGPGRAFPTLCSQHLPTCSIPDLLSSSSNGPVRSWASLYDQWRLRPTRISRRARLPAGNTVYGLFILGLSVSVSSTHLGV